MGCISMDKLFIFHIFSSVPEKIPRLYTVTDAHIIRQIPLNSVLDNGEDSYLLDDGESVTMYQSPTCEIKRKITRSLSAYIINVENGGHYKLTLIFYSSGERNFETAFKTFRDKVSSIVNVDCESKRNFLPKNDVGSSKPVNKKGKAKTKNTTKSDSEQLASIVLDIYEVLNKYKKLYQEESTELQTQTDSTDSSFNNRSSTSTTTSTSTVPTRANSRKKSKAAKRKTSLKETGNSSLLESEFTNAVTISTATDSGNNKYENLIPIFIGTKECVPEPQPLPIDTLKSKCIYMLKDLGNKETIIYLGSETEYVDQGYAIAAGELDIIENSSWKLTIVLPDDTIPTAFMINIKSEIEEQVLAKI